jgi:hypothetical protein
MFFQTPLQVDGPPRRAMVEFAQNCAKARLVGPRLSEEPIKFIDPQVAVRSGCHVSPSVLPLRILLPIFFDQYTKFSVPIGYFILASEYILMSPVAEALFDASPRAIPMRPFRAGRA